MNLVSCDHCATVLDTDKMFFWDNFYKEDGSVDTTKAKWDGEGYVSALPCTHCGELIVNDETRYS